MRAAQSRRARGLELGQGALDEVAGIDSSVDLLACAPEGGAGCGERGRTRRGGEALVAQQLVHRGQVPELHGAKCTALHFARPMRLRPVLFALFFLAVVAGLAVGAYSLRGHMYAHEALPGVRVLGTDVSGSDATAAAAKIDRAAAPLLAAPVTVVAAGHTLSVVPGDLVRVDSAATAAAALEAGRGSVSSRALALLSPLPAQRNVAPVLTLRRRAAGALFAKLDGYGKPSASATVTLAGLDPVVHPARAGTRVDQQAFVDALERHVATGHSAIVVRYRRADPTVSTNGGDDCGDPRPHRPLRPRSAAVLRDRPRLARPHETSDAASLPAERACARRDLRPGDARRGRRTARQAVAPARGRRAPGRERQAGSPGAGARGQRPRRGRDRVRARGGDLRPDRPDRRRHACARAAQDHDRVAAQARDPASARLVHDRHGLLVVEPDPQRAPDGRLHRRHDHQAGRSSSRSTRSSARAPPRAASSRARRSSAALSCRRSAAASARPRRRSSTTPSRPACRSSSGRTTTCT